MSVVYSTDVLLILLASMLYMSSPMLTTPLITGYAESMGAGGALMGLIGGMMNVCSLCCRPAAGNLADRVSKFRLSLVGTEMLLAATTGYLFCTTPAMLILFRLFHGVGFSCCSVALSTWVAELLPRDKVGAGMGLYGTMNALAGAVGPALGVRVYQHFGYRAAFLCACLFAVGCMVTLFFVRDKGLPVPAARGEKGARRQLADPKIFPIAMIVMLYTIPYSATQSYLVRYVEVRQLAVAVSLFFPTYAVILVAMRMGMKSLFDKLPFGVFVLGGAGSVCAAMYLLGTMTGNVKLLCATVFMAGSYGLMCSAGQSRAILLAGEGRRGLANSTYYIGLDLGLALGPILGGQLYEKLDPQWFFPSLAMTAPLAVLIYLANRRGMETERK